MENKIKELLSKSELFNGLSYDEIDVLLKDSRNGVKTINKGELVFDEGDKADKFFILLSGFLLVSQDTLSGKRLILTRIVNPGDMFGEIYPFMGASRYDMYVEAVEESIVFEMDLDVVYCGLNKEFDRVANILRKNLIRIFAHKAYVMNRRLRVLGAAGIRGKIARLLTQRQKDQDRMRDLGPDNDKIKRAAFYSGDNKSIVKVRPREEMADFLNVARPSLSREISAMVDEGIIKTGDGYIEILDQEALEEYL